MPCVFQIAAYRRQAYIRKVRLKLRLPGMVIDVMALQCKSNGTVPPIKRTSLLREEDRSCNLLSILCYVVPIFACSLAWQRDALHLARALVSGQKNSTIFSS